MNKILNIGIGTGAGLLAFVLFVVYIALPQDEAVAIPAPIAEQIGGDDNTNQTSDQNDKDPQPSIGNVTFVEETEEDPVDNIPANTTSLFEFTTDSNDSPKVTTSRYGGGTSGGDDEEEDDNSSDENTFDLQLYEGDQESDGQVDLGQTATAVSSTDDGSVSEVTFRWIDPTNSVAKTETNPVESGSSQSNFEPNEIGTWIVEADFGNGEVQQETFDVSFLVIPESPIGILALVGASLAGLGGFYLLRGRHSSAAI